MPKTFEIVTRVFKETQNTVLDLYDFEIKEPNEALYQLIWRSAETLKLLNINGNALSNASAKALFTTLKNRKDLKLKYLALNHNEFATSNFDAMIDLFNHLSLEQFPEFLDLSYNYFKKLDSNSLFKLFFALSRRPQLKHLDLSDNQFTESEIVHIKKLAAEQCPHLHVNFELGTHIMTLFLQENAEIQKRLNEARVLADRRDTINIYLDNEKESYRAAILSAEECRQKVTHFIDQVKASYPEVYSSEEYIPQLSKIVYEAKGFSTTAIFKPFSAQHLAKSSEFKFLVNSNVIDQEMTNEAFYYFLEEGNIPLIYSFFDYVNNNKTQAAIKYLIENKPSIVKKLLKTALANINDFNCTVIAKTILPHMDPAYIYNHLESIPKSLLSQKQIEAIVTITICRKSSDIFIKYWNLLSEDSIKMILTEGSTIQTLPNFDTMIMQYLKNEIDLVFVDNKLFSQRAKKGLFSLYGLRVDNEIKKRLSNMRSFNSIAQIIIQSPLITTPLKTVLQEDLKEIEAIKRLIMLIDDAGLLDARRQPYGSSVSYSPLSIVLAKKGLEHYLPEITNKHQRIKYFIQGIESNSIEMLNFSVENIDDNDIEDFFLSSCENETNLLNKLLNQKGGPLMLAQLKLSKTARGTVNALLLKQHIGAIGRRFSSYDTNFLISDLNLNNILKDSNTILINAQYFDSLDIALINAEMAQATFLLNKPMVCRYISPSSSSSIVLTSNSLAEPKECDPKKGIIIMAILEATYKRVYAAGRDEGAIYSNLVKEIRSKYPAFFQSSDVIKGLIPLINGHKNPVMAQILIDQFSIEDICDNFCDFSIDLFKEDTLIQVFNHLHKNNEQKKLLLFILKGIPSNVLIKIIPLIIEMNYELCFNLCWIKLSYEDRKILIYSKEYEKTRASSNFAPWLKNSISESIIIFAKNLYGASAIVELYALSDKLFNESIHSILNNEEEKEKLLYYFAHLLKNTRDTNLNNTLKSLLYRIIDSHLFFKHFSRSEAAALKYSSLLEIMIKHQPAELINTLKGNDKFLKEAFLEVLEHSIDSMPSFIALVGNHLGQDTLIDLLLSETVQENSDVLSSTVANRLFSVLTNEKSRGLSSLKKDFAVSDKLMAILIAEVSKVLSSNIKNNGNLIRFYIDVLGEMSRENVQKFINQLYDSLPSGNATILLDLYVYGLNFPLLIELLLAKIDSVKLTELIDSNLIPDVMLNNKYFKNSILKKADGNVLEAILKKEHLHQWLDFSVINEVMNQSNDTKEKLLKILVSSPLRRGFTYSILIHHFAKDLEQVKNIIGEAEFIDVVLDKKHSFGFRIHPSYKIPINNIPIIGALLQKILTEINPNYPRYKEFVQYVDSYAQRYNDYELRKYAADLYRQVMRDKLQILSLGQDGQSFRATLNELLVYINDRYDAELLTEVIDAIMSNMANNTPEILNQIRTLSDVLSSIHPNTANMQKAKLAQFELYGKSVDDLRKANPSKVKGKKVELPLLVAQALVFDKILTYLIEKYEEVKGSEPKKLGQKADKKWTKYQERLNHYAKFHDAMIYASMQQPASTDLGAELGKIFKNNPLPDTNAVFTSDRYGQLIKLLITTPTPVLLLRFKEMADKVELLYKGNNPPHPVKELVRALEALRLFTTDQFSKQQQISEVENSDKSVNIIDLSKQDNNHSQYSKVLFLSASSNHTPKQRKNLENQMFESVYNPIVNTTKMKAEKKAVFVDNEAKDNEEQNNDPKITIPTIRFEL